jgi:hypothetical protein
VARGHLFRKITDSSGNIVPNTVVTIYENGTTTPLVQPLFDTALGSGVIANPHTTSDGFVSFYLNTPQSVRLGLAVQGATETFFDDVPVTPAPENLVQATLPVNIVNDPTDGWFLQAGLNGAAAWVDAGDLVNSKPSPLRQIYSYDFSGGEWEDLTFFDATGVAVVPTLVDVTADTKPLGWELFTQALQLPSTMLHTLRVPAQTFPESGTVIYLYKVVTTNPAGLVPAMLRVVVDDGLLAAETPVVADLTNTWLVGYLDDIPSGSHRVVIEHKPGTDPASYVLIGPVWLQYGNNIPAHTHEGVGAGSVRLGVGALADYDGSTVVGAGAVASGANATSYGYFAKAQAGGTSVGANSVAGPDAVAVGYRATGPVDRRAWVSIGKDAVASEDEAVAIGPTSRAQGTAGIAVGSGARTGTPAEAIAIGPSAQALALRSIAIGRGAMVAAGHDNSVAIGSGVTTTAANQARIGDTATTVVIPGNFRQVGGDALFGASDKKLGFYGAAGIIRPSVLGSRGGNTTLATLLGVLDSLGLIRDQSTP